MKSVQISDGSEGHGVMCVCAAGKPVAGQRLSADKGLDGGRLDWQPLRLGFPPLQLSSGLQGLQRPPARGEPSHARISRLSPRSYK